MTRRVIIAGGRELTARFWAFDKIREHVQEGDIIVSGGARGADKIGEDYALTTGLQVELHPANWDLHGRAAGPIRNRKMAEVGDVLIALWDGVSKGTKNMIETALKLKLELHVYIYEPAPPAENQQNFWN